MPRRPRIHLDGVPLHIVQRGHNREACFLAEEDGGFNFKVRQIIKRRILHAVF